MVIKMERDCMWRDHLVVVFDQTGILVEAWYTMTNEYGEYCGRDPIFPETWRTN